MTAKQYLSRADGLRRRIAAKELHLEELHTQAEHITADLTGMPRGSGTSSPVERVAVQIADLSQEIEYDWLDLIAYQEEIRKTIELLPDPVMVQVLSYRYLSYKRWQDIADLMHYSVRHTTRIHGYALKAIDGLLCP